MNKESNGYIITFSIGMVVVVGVTLAVVSQLTKPFQEQNVKLEKMQNILTSIGLNYGETEDPNDIEYKREETEKVFAEYIKEAYVYNIDGDLSDQANKEIANSKAFQLDLAAELKKDEKSQAFPLFIAEKEGKRMYIIPMRGKGLWDAIWGYVSISIDGRTVIGASFDHKGETPGLGAEIKETAFQAQFINKQIADEAGAFKSVHVYKKGKVTADSPEAKYAVDGISGGTITSNGVDEMLNKYFLAFRNYITKNASAVTTLPATVDSLKMDTLVMPADSTKIDSLIAQTSLK